MTAGTAEYPTQPIRMVVAYAPGSTTDFTAPLHMPGEQLKLAVGMNMLHVPHKGAVPAPKAILNHQRRNCQGRQAGRRARTHRGAARRSHLPLAGEFAKFIAGESGTRVAKAGNIRVD